MNTTSGQRHWRLCTRTENADYFWINERLRPPRPPVATPTDPAPETVEPPPLYTDVVDESDRRCGYLLADGSCTALLVNRLEAGRADRFGRPIKNTFYLETRADDLQGNAAIRQLFVEAILASTNATSAAEDLAHRLFEAWERRKDAASPVSIDWLSVLPPSSRKDDPVFIPSLSIQPGGTFRRDENTVTQLARLAQTPAPGLVVLAALNAPEAIRAAARRYLPSLVSERATIVAQRNESHPPIRIQPKNNRFGFWILAGLLLLALAGCLIYHVTRRQAVAESVAEPEPPP